MNDNSIPSETDREGNVFVNHRCMAYWHVEKNAAAKLDPHKLTMKSGKKAWFTCPNPECAHVFQRKIYDMPNDPTKNICPFCVKFSSRLCENTNLEQGGCGRCYNRTFAVCEKASEWSSRNEKPAHQHMRSGRGSAWFTCSDCKHDYSALLIHACTSGGAPCPFCAGRSACDVTDCQTCALARNRPPRIQIDEQKAIQDAEAGRRTCDTCGETKLLESFAKLNSGNRRATCTSCRNHAATRRGLETVEEANKSNNTFATKVCRECNHPLHLSDFGPGRNICPMCRSRQDAKNAQLKATVIEPENTKIINGYSHRGELPGSCRTCQRPFSLENASDFRYRHDLCKYINHCIECRAKQECSKNCEPINKLNSIRYGATARNIQFTKEDTDDMLTKLIKPCYYCGIDAYTFGSLSGLDRVDNTQGYNAENTVPCCTTCNLMKGTMTLDEFKNQIMYCMLHLKPDMVNSTLIYQLPERIAGTTRGILKRTRDQNEEYVANEGNKNISVVFYNLHTGRIAHKVSSVKEAGDLVGIKPVYARTKIHRYNIPWILPNWGARPSETNDDLPDPDEKMAMFTALDSGKRSKHPHYTHTYQVSSASQEVIVFRNLASIAKVLPNMNLEYVTQQFACGKKLVQINPTYWVEVVANEDIPNTKCPV